MTAITVATAARGRTHTVRLDGRTACGRPIDFTAGWTGRVPSVTVDCARCSHVPADRAVAAEQARDAITVAVDDDAAEELHMHGCDVFGHEMVGGTCEVCGQPDPDAARVAADTALGTLASEPGGFGAALVGLGFGEGESGHNHLTGAWWRSEHESGAYRVISYGDDGYRVILIGWDPERPLAKLEAWRVEFGGTTPQSVVLAAIANAIGVLPVSR